MSKSNGNSGLLTKDLDLNGRKITVSESTNFSMLKRGQLQGELSANPRDDLYVQTFLLNVYAPLVACSLGDIPSPDEFLQMREQDTETWVQEARKLNPLAFPWLDAAEKLVEELTEEEKIKKKRKRRTSTAG
jgi:hypothetical protein